MNTSAITIGQSVTIVRADLTLTGTVTAVQTAGCTHGMTAVRGGRKVWTTSHGERPCPDRDQIAGLALRTANGLRWMYVNIPQLPVRIYR